MNYFDTDNRKFAKEFVDYGVFSTDDTLPYKASEESAMGEYVHPLKDMRSIKLHKVKDKSIDSMNNNRIRLTESQLRRIVKESVDSILKEGSKKKDPMAQWFNDFNKASKYRETMDYVNKGGRNPLSKNKNENLNEGDVRFIPHLQRDIETLHSLYEKWQYAENKPEGIDDFIDAVLNAKHIMQDIKSSLSDCEY